MKFLFYVVEVTASHVKKITKKTEESSKRSLEVEKFVFKLFGCILTCLTHLLKSGLCITRVQ